MAVDDEGKSFTPSSDPMLETCGAYVRNIELGSTGNIEEKIAPVLHMEKIFGVDIYEAGLAPKVVGYYKELIAGPGAVRATLKKYV